MRAEQPRWLIPALLVFTLALHLPFIHQAFHMDDVQYLDLSQNVLSQPLFPQDKSYVFDGKVFSNWTGHSHPPLNAYFLALVSKLAGGLTEPLAHGFYLVFPLLSTGAFFTLARRFTRRPALATLLFATIPPLVVMSHTVMADAPTLALMLAGFACFITGVEEQRRSRLLLAALALSAAAFCSYIAPAALLPLLAFAWLKRRLNGGILLVLAAPIFLLMAWQYASYLHFGQWPILVLRSYAEQLGYLQTEMRERAAASVFVFLGGTILFPILLAGVTFRAAPWAGAIAGIIGAVAISFSHLLDGYALPQRLIVALCFGLGLAIAAAAFARWLKSVRRGSSEAAVRDESFLLFWFLFTLAAVLALYNVGSNRYLLPLAPPLVLWSFHRLEDRLSGAWLRSLLLAALVWNLGWSFTLAQADYEFAGAYRDYAHRLAQKRTARTPLFFSGEWGFRHYLDSSGGEILSFASEPAAGAWVVKSRLCLSRAFDEHLDAALVPLESETLTVRTPWRMLDRDSRAGFYSTAWGMLPWSWSRAPLDIVTLYNWSPFYFALDQARLENATAEQVYPTRISYRGEPVLVFMQPGNSAVTFPLTLGNKPRLRFQFYAESAAEGSSALRYRITLRAGDRSVIVFEDGLRPANAPSPLRRWVELPLESWGGENVELRFSIKGKAARAGWASLTLLGN